MENCKGDVSNRKWSSKDIHCLLDLCKNNIGNIAKRTTMWDSVAEELNRIREQQFTGNQCNWKFKKLKSYYEKIKNQQNKDQWEYYDKMHALLYNHLEITPPAICSTAKCEVIIMEDVAPSSSAINNFFGDIEELSSDSCNSLTTKTKFRIRHGFIQKWTSKDINCLLELYKKNIGKYNKFTNNKMWESIAVELNKIRKRKITGNQCSWKFKNLKRKYKKIQKLIDKGEKHRKHWAHYDIMHVTQNIPKKTQTAEYSIEDETYRILEENLLKKKRYNDLFEKYLDLLESKNLENRD